MATTRTRRLSILISDEEWAMLQSVADRSGITASDWVRLRIRDAYGQVQPTPAKRKARSGRAS